MAPVIVVYGPPGSGKTVQAKKLAEALDYEWLSSGELLRASKDPEIIERISRGELARSKDVNRIVKRAIDSLQPGRGVVLDGFPRMIAEINWMINYLPTVNRAVKAALVLNVTVNESHRRLHQRAIALGRHDDTNESIDRRWRRYQDRMASILAYFEGKGLLKSIDASDDVDKVFAQIRSAI